MARRSPRSQRWVTMIALLATLLTACSTTAPPGERFAEALEATFADSFAFEVLLEADQAALADLGAQAGPAAALLSGIRLHGVVDGQDTAISLDALGGNLVELRQLGAPDAPVAYVRAGVVDLLAQVGFRPDDVESDLLADLVAADAPAEVLVAVVDAFDGEWVGIDGGLGTGLGEAAGLVPPTDGPASTATFGTDLASFLDRFVEVSELDDGILHLELRLDELLRTAAGVGRELDVGREVLEDGLEDDLDALPARVPGDVRVHDGVVEEMAFDVAEAARALGNDVEGRVVVRIRVTEHGRAGPVVAPDGVSPVPGDAIDAAAVAILRAFGLG